MNQVLNSNITSKFTSVNTKKLPAIFSKIDWEALKDWYKVYEEEPIVLDYGCGRNPTLAKEYVESFGFKYIGYDPYWLSAQDNSIAEHCDPHIIVCSNVLNVIPSWERQCNIHSHIRSITPYYFISVYEGDRSYNGHETKKDCWQWNKPTHEYLIHYSEKMKKKVISSNLGIVFVK